jgi:hypothetical protein
MLKSLGQARVLTIIVICVLGALVEFGRTDKENIVGKIPPEKVSEIYFIRGPASVANPTVNSHPAVGRTLRSQIEALPVQYDLFEVIDVNVARFIANHRRRQPNLIMLGIRNLRNEQCRRDICAAKEYFGTSDYLHHICGVITRIPIREIGRIRSGQQLLHLSNEQKWPVNVERSLGSFGGRHGSVHHIASDLYQLLVEFGNADRSDAGYNTENRDDYCRYIIVALLLAGSCVITWLSVCDIGIVDWKLALIALVLGESGALTWLCGWPWTWTWLWS